MRLLDYKYLIGVAMLLKIGMVGLEDHVEIEKTFPNPGEAINFKKKKKAWLNDQYNSEFG